MRVYTTEAEGYLIDILNTTILSLNQVSTKTFRIVWTIHKTRALFCPFFLTRFECYKYLATDEYIE